MDLMSWIRALIMPAFALGAFAYMYHKDEQFFGEGEETPSSLPGPCKCGGKDHTYLGFQEGMAFDLDLFNCQTCGTTRAVRIPKRVG